MEKLAQGAQGTFPDHTVLSIGGLHTNADLIDSSANAKCSDQALVSTHKGEVWVWSATKCELLARGLVFPSVPSPAQALTLALAPGLHSWSGVEYIRSITVAGGVIVAAAEEKATVGGVMGNVTWCPDISKHMKSLGACVANPGAKKSKSARTNVRGPQFITAAVTPSSP